MEVTFTVCNAPVPGGLAHMGWAQLCKTSNEKFSPVSKSIGWSIFCCCTLLRIAALLGTPPGSLHWMILH